MMLLFPLMHRSQTTTPGSFDETIAMNAQRLLEEGRTMFRYQTFGSQVFWTLRMRLHEAIGGPRAGGSGPGLTPRAALTAGLKVDLERLPQPVVDALRAGQVNLDDPAVTMVLLENNAVLGVVGFFESNQPTAPRGRLLGVGITCALCHSTVDNALAAGIGRRLDGWPNRDLNVGAVINLAPTVAPFAELLQVDEASVRRVFSSWGPGKFDAELVLDGKAFRPDGKSAATLIPAAFGLAGVNLHTYTGWGSVTHWNAFVSNLEMQGLGTFWDPRLNDAAKFPIAARTGMGNRRGIDHITPYLAAIHVYQLDIPAPAPPAGSFNASAAERGRLVFNGAARCATCHVPPLYTEPGWNMHTPQEIGIDSFQADRSPDGCYRTTPLRGLFARTKGGFYHDGRFATLNDVIEHYNSTFNLGLGTQERADLAEFLKSL